MFGPSGSGKSTLLTAMALINPPTSGQIVIRGKLVMDRPRALVDLRAFRRQHLGFVFQKANLIPFLTAQENVQIALEVNDTSPKIARKRAMELLDYPSISARANNLPAALRSGCRLTAFFATMASADSSHAHRPHCGHCRAPLALRFCQFVFLRSCLCYRLLSC